MNFARNLRYLRRLNHTSQNDLADFLGYKSFTTIQKWEDGSATPAYKTIARIAQYYNVDVEEFMNEDLSIHSNSEIPILGIVRGGLPLEADQQYLGYEHVFPDDAKHKDCFYLQVVGDSMKDLRILPGDLLYVHKQDTLNSGDIGVISIDNEATVKTILFQGDNIVLQPANDAYEPIVLTKQDVETKNIKIIGKVLHNRIKF